MPLAEVRLATDRYEVNFLLTGSLDGADMYLFVCVLLNLNPAIGDPGGLLEGTFCCGWSSAAGGIIGEAGGKAEDTEIGSNEGGD